MKVTVGWLKEFVDFDLPVEELVERFDLSGTKVETVNSPGAEVSGVVVAEVLRIDQHPNADNLTLVEVKLDGDATQRVVCGARNFSVGDRVPLARVGSRLPGMEITERKIRGELSAGMLCSGMELGVTRDHSGILVLPPDSPLGQDVVETLRLDDTIIEFEITLNRPDCMGVVGVAREVAALTGGKLKVPELDLETVPDLESPVQVRIEDREACPRFTARYIDGVRVAPSPHWMATRLLACGVRPISNVVDITNYVMLELGHPLHAFDAAKVNDQTIVVRRARATERLRTLDGVDRELHPDDLLIADPRGAIGLAGVIGGETSEVSDSTSSVLLEVAYFDPSTIAFTTRRHALRTEASARFERGMDPATPPIASARAAQLLSELAGGRVSSVLVDEYPRPVERERIRLRPSRTNKILGITISPREQVERLRSIELEVEEAGDALEVTVPGFRPDLAREIDLVEEVARLHGLQELPSTLPPGAAGGLDRPQRAERLVRTALATLGLYEAWTPSLGSPHDLDMLGLDEEHPARRTIAPSNPMSEDESVLRTTLLPSLLRALARNQARHIPDVALYEVARVYERSDDVLPQEALVLASAMSGDRSPKTWNRPAVPWDFFAGKAIIEALADVLRLPPLGYDSVSGMPFHPTRAASIVLGDTPVGVLGELHPDVCERFDVAEGTVAFELSLAPLFAALPERVQVEQPSKLPSTYMDLAVVVDEAVAAADVQGIIERAGAPEVTAVRLFDLYRGEQIEAGKKSLAFALELSHPDRTMTDEEAAAVRDRILPALQERTGAQLRG